MKQLSIILFVGCLFVGSSTNAESSVLKHHYSDRLSNPKMARLQENPQFSSYLKRFSQRGSKNKHWFGSQRIETNPMLGKLQQPFLLDAVNFLVGAGYASMSIASSTVLIGNIVAMAMKRWRLGWGISGIVIGTSVGTLSGIFAFSGDTALYTPIFIFSLTNLALGIANVVLSQTQKKSYRVSPFVMHETNGGIIGGLSMLGKF